MNIIDTLVQMGSEVNQLSNQTINFGGCGNYAWALAVHLRETVDPNVAIVIDRHLFERPRNVDDARENIYPSHRNRVRRWVDNGINFHHVRVLFTHQGKQYVADSSGVLTLNEYYGNVYHHNGTMKVDELEPLIRPRVRIWNRRFKRKTIPFLYETIDAHLNKVSNTSVMKLANR